MLHVNITRCVFIHIGIPGQEKGAADLATDFPSMQVIAKCSLCQSLRVDGQLVILNLSGRPVHQVKHCIERGNIISVLYRPRSFLDIEFAQSID